MVTILISRLHRVAQTLHHAAFAHQVAKAEHPWQRRGVRQQQGQLLRATITGKEDSFPLADGAQLHHADFALSLRGQRLHNRRLD